MEILEVVNGWYADAWPDGQWAVLLRDNFNVVTSNGPLPTTPVGGPLYLRIYITPDGVMKLCGQSNDNRNTGIEWNGQRWVDHAPILACGMNGAIYDNDGRLFLSDCSIGVAGWRYVTSDNRLITGDDTASPTPTIPLCEWIDLGDGLYIGQDINLPHVMLWDGRHLRIVYECPAQARFINARRQGNKVSFGFYIEKNFGSRLIWMDMEELKNSPILPPQPDIKFNFNHKIIVAVFKDPNHQSGVWQAETDIGVFTEADDITDLVIANPTKRIVWCYDAGDLPKVPHNLRMWDQVWVELYRDQDESIQESVSRWIRNLHHVLGVCENDIGVVPMFYCQGGAPPDELWAIPEVLEAIRPLSMIVNLSDRIKVIAPFAYERLNGITAHSELQRTFDELKKHSDPSTPFTPITPYPTPGKFPRAVVYTKGHN